MRTSDSGRLSDWGRVRAALWRREELGGVRAVSSAVGTAYAVRRHLLASLLFRRNHEVDGKRRIEDASLSSKTYRSTLSPRASVLSTVLARSSCSALSMRSAMAWAWGTVFEGPQEARSRETSTPKRSRAIVVLSRPLRVLVHWGPLLARGSGHLCGVPICPAPVPPHGSRSAGAPRISSLP